MLGWKWDPRHSGPQSAISARAASSTELARESIFPPVGLLVADSAGLGFGVLRKRGAAAEGSGEHAGQKGQNAGQVSWGHIRTASVTRGPGPHLTTVLCSVEKAAEVWGARG